MFRPSYVNLESDYRSAITPCPFYLIFVPLFYDAVFEREQRVRLVGWLRHLICAPVCIVQADDIVLADIVAHLHFDKV